MALGTIWEMFLDVLAMTALTPPVQSLRHLVWEYCEAMVEHLESAPVVPPSEPVYVELVVNSVMLRVETGEVVGLLVVSCAPKQAHRR